MNSVTHGTLKLFRLYGTTNLHPLTYPNVLKEKKLRSESKRRPLRDRTLYTVFCIKPRVSPVVLQDLRHEWGF